MQGNDYSVLLRLTIDTDRPVRARDCARIIERLNEAFARLPREKHIYSTEHYELRLVHLHAGSLVADLMGFAGGFVTLAEFYEAAIRLIGRLNEALKIMRGKSKRDLGLAESLAIKAMNAPVLHDNARLVSLHVTGDNNNVFIIDRKAAAAIGRFIAKSHATARREDPVPSYFENPDLGEADLKHLNSAAKRGVRGTAIRKRSGWLVQWPIWFEEVWTMKLVAEPEVLRTLIDGAEYIFIGSATATSKAGLTFFATCAEHWDDARLPW